MVCAHFSVPVLTFSSSLTVLILSVAFCVSPVCVCSRVIVTLFCAPVPHIPVYQLGSPHTVIVPLLLVLLLLVLLHLCYHPVGCRFVGILLCSRCEGVVLLNPDRLRLLLEAAVGWAAI